MCAVLTPDALAILGLDNYNLEHVKVFTKDTGELIKGFFKQLQAPICLVAHNGFNFDYPIFRKQLDKVVKLLGFRSYVLKLIQYRDDNFRMYRWKRFYVWTHWKYSEK